jgi:hypothetical protein
VQKIAICLHDPAFIHRFRSDEKAFTRERKLTFAHLVLFLLNLVKGSVEDELDAFFQTLHDQEPDALFATKSAFTQARKKLKSEVFIELNRLLVDTLYQQDCRRWHGFRVLAVDGSVLNLPEQPALRAHFQPEAQNRPQARASQLYDVLNQVTLDARLAPMSVDERTLAAAHLAQTQEGDLTLFDRGYPAFYLFALHRQTSRDFCARSPWNLYNETRDFWFSGAAEQRVTLKPSGDSIRQCRAEGLSCEPLEVRLVRVDLPSGEPEILITSVLDQAHIPAEDFKALYHLRWGIEEDYKKMKSHLEVEQFSGLSVLAVQQDFHAKVFSKNLTSLLVTVAQRDVDQQTAHRKRRYKVNFTRALSRMKHQIVRLFTLADVSGLLERLVRLMAQSIEAVRPERSYPRKPGRGPKYATNYKGAR